MEELQPLINTLQEENRALIAERDRFKKLASLYQAEAFEEKLKSLTTNEGHDKAQEEQRQRDHEEWEKEKLKQRGELEKAWSKERKRLEQSRLKEKEESQRLMEELEKKLRAEWVQKLAKERASWEKERLVEKEEWEKRVQEMKKEYRKQYSDEVTRWKERMAQQKQAMDCQRERERSDWMNKVDALEERVSELQAAQRHSASSNGTPDDPVVTSSSATHQSESPPPFSSTLNGGAHTLMSSSESRDSSPDIMDLVSDSELTPELEEESVRSPEHSATSPAQDANMQDEPAIAPSSALPASLPAHKPLKIEGITLSDSRRAHYLTGTTTYTITPDSLPVSISYSVLNRLYGTGNTSLEWISIAGPKGKEYRVMTPSYSKNPHMPRAPGEPGLALVTHDSIVNQSPWTLFYKLDTGKNPPKWGYAGEYECKEVGKIMGKDFAALSDEMKNTWVESVCKRSGQGPLLDLRARMTLRKLGKRKPTSWEVHEEGMKIKYHKHTYNLTQDDVINSFVRGEEHIKIISLQCVGYIHSKAHELMAEQQKADSAKFLSVVQPTVSIGKRAWEPLGGAITAASAVNEGSTATSSKRRKTVGTSQDGAQASVSVSIPSTRVEPQLDEMMEGNDGEDGGDDEDDPNEDQEGEDKDEDGDDVDADHNDDDDIYCDN